MKGKRTDLDSAPCAIARSLSSIGDWWSLLIVREALGGTRRFGDFQRNIGLAKNILSARLHKLVERGIFMTAPASDGSAYREYVLTPKGEKLYVVVVALWQWGEEFCFAPGELTYDMVDKKSLKPFQKLEVRAKDGRLVRPMEMRPWSRSVAKKQDSAKRA